MATCLVAFGVIGLIASKRDEDTQSLRVDYALILLAGLLLTGLAIGLASEEILFFGTLGAFALLLVGAITVIAGHLRVVGMQSRRDGVYMLATAFILLNLYNGVGTLYDRRVTSALATFDDRLAADDLTAARAALDAARRFGRIKPAVRTAAERLTVATARAEQYARGKELLQQGRWTAAVGVLSPIKGYRDADALITTALTSERQQAMERFRDVVSSPTGIRRRAEFAGLLQSRFTSRGMAVFIKLEGEYSTVLRITSRRWSKSVIDRFQQALHVEIAGFTVMHAAELDVLGFGEVIFDNGSQHWHVPLENLVRPTANHPGTPP